MENDDYPMLADGYLEALEDRPTDEIRAMRATCVDAETAVSFARRLVQGRLDILAAEQQRRREDGPPSDIGALVARLPEILGEHGRAAGPGRLPRSIEPPDPPEDVVARLEEIVPAGRLGSLPDLDDAELTELAGRVETLEHEVSARRRELFQCIDVLQSELTRRYRTGEASVESLLSDVPDLTRPS